MHQGKNTRSKHRQITSPGSVFFLSCWRQEMQTKDRLWEGTHYLLRNSGFASAPFTRPGLFSDLWGKWILERPFGYPPKSLSLFSRSTLGFSYQQLSHTSVKTFLNVQHKGSELLPLTAILAGKISTVHLPLWRHLSCVLFVSIAGPRSKAEKSTRVFIF